MFRICLREMRHSRTALFPELCLGDGRVRTGNVIFEERGLFILQVTIQIPQTA